MEFIFFLILFISLFLLSRALTATLSLFFIHTTRSHSFAIQFLAILFLPGVIIHELAHWLIASILFVPTGTIEFLPQVQGDNVKLGSVQIAKTDPIRRFLIGIAPVIFGLTVMLGIFWFLSPSFTPLTWKSIIFFYIVFEIGNTMFSSAKDLEGVIGFLILAFLFTSLLFFLRIPILAILKTIFQSPAATELLKTLNIFLLFALGIDMLLYGGIFLLMKVLRK